MSWEELKWKFYVRCLSQRVWHIVGTQSPFIVPVFPEVTKIKALGLSSHADNKRNNVIYFYAAVWAKGMCFINMYWKVFSK